MLGAGLGGYGGYASPEGLADAHGMGYGDNEGGMGGGYNSFMRGLLDAYARLYGGNSSLLGHNRSVFGGPMMTSGPTDVQGTMIGGYLPGPTSNTPHNSQLGSVDLTGGVPRNDYGFLANNANILGLGPNYNGIGMDFGGHPGSVGPMGPAEGGGEPYVRPRRLAYENAYDQFDEQGGFFGGM